MEKELQARFCEAAAHLQGLSGVSVFVFDIEKEGFLDREKTFCNNCTNERCNPENTHNYGIDEAVRWGGKYMFYCPLGLVFSASACLDDNYKLCGGLVAGPVVMGDLPDTLAGISDKNMYSKVLSLPVLAAERVNHLAGVLLSCSTAATKMVYGRQNILNYNTENLLKTIYNIQNTKTKAEFFYPIEYEKQLHDLIVRHDKGATQALINELLGHIYFSSNYELDTVKARITELLVLLSRAIIEAGADIREIFSENSNYFHEIERLSGLEELNIWLSAVIRRFVNLTFDFTDVKHSDVVHKAMDYIRSHYSEKITLDDIARHVYLSRSYLSKIFKEETSIGITDYIKKVRIEKSKLFLLDNKIKVADIAEICGFDDQSYFTKVFRTMVGVSPKKYRDCRGRLPQISDGSAGY